MRRLLNWRVFLLAFVLIFLLAFPYGPLLPWSPVHPGYEEHEFARAKVLYPVGSKYPEVLTHVDEYITRAEKFHRLAMKSRVTMVLCSDWSDFKRFMPHLRGREAAGVTIATGTVIYITPKVAEKGFDLGEYVRHELSHAVLNQNQPLVEALRMTRQQWFSEGLAVCFGEQKSYISPEEFLGLARKQDLGPIIDPVRRREAQRPIDIRVGYQAWRYFLEYLIEARGRDRFQQFLTSYLADPGNYRALFERTYGISFTQAIADFETAIRAARWQPNPDFVSQHLVE